MPGLHRLRMAARRWGWIVGAVLAAVALGWGSFYIGHLQAENEALAQAVDRQREQAVESGQTPVVPPADEIQRDPDVIEAPPPELPAPTDEQLRPLVQQYVDAWLARNPPQPGRDGRTPTVDQITDLITQVYEQNPPPPGEDGHTPTAEEIRAIVRPIVAEEVAAYLAENPPPPGQDGADGTPGRDGVDGQDGKDGAPGEPPESWTTTRCDILGQCVTERCVRTEPFDEQRPTYTCSQEPA